MQINDFAAQVVAQLSSTAALGDARTQEIAAALGDSAQSAVRLAVLHAVSGAADEITAALLEAGAPGAPVVAAHLDGADVAFRVTLTAAEPTPEPSPEEGDATARISLRLSENLKKTVEQAAERESVSVNTWLVRAARSALAPGWGAPPGGWGGSARGGHRISGWVSG
jgi:hypothetical protein